MIKKLTVYIARLANIQISRIKNTESHIPDLVEKFRACDLANFNKISQSIPGMIAHEEGQMLYALCYMQKIHGDVLEIGSWQGRSTVYLARAVADSKNGKLVAIDHFQGNVGKEAAYIVGAPDLSDLKNNFIKNVDKAGLSDYVELFDMPSKEAAKILHGREFRFVFIDGDHSEAGVRGDLNWVLKCCKPGTIIAFDDYSTTFPELVNVLGEFILEYKPSRLFAIKNALFLELPETFKKSVEY